jgi:putative IMPACT (imprinted ancient) family translation regulator
VRAYSGAANAVCDVAEIIDYIPQGEAELFARFSDAGTLEQACADDGITILDRQFDTDGTRIKIAGPREHLSELKARFPLPA